MHVTGDAFAAEKWPEIGCFVRAEVSAVSFRGSGPPALVPPVSGEVVGGCFEVAVAPVGAKKLAQRVWILGGAAKKFALLAKIGPFWAVLPVQGELFRAWALMEASRANFFARVGPSRGSGA